VHSLNFLNGPGSLLFKSVHVRSNQKGKGTLSSPVAAIVTEVLPSACLQKTYAIPRRKGRFLSVVLMSRVCLDSFGGGGGSTSIVFLTVACCCVAAVQPPPPLPLLLGRRELPTIESRKAMLLSVPVQSGQG